MTWLDTLTEKALARELPTRAAALKVLQGSDDELMDVVAAAFKVRLRYFGRRVKLNYLVNIKSGLCPEDCFYWSQRLGSAADVLKHQQAPFDRWRGGMGLSLPIAHRIVQAHRGVLWALPGSRATCALSLPLV